MNKSNKNLKIIFLVCLVSSFIILSNATSYKKIVKSNLKTNALISNDEPSLFIEMINKLMELYRIHNNNQYQNCFTSQQANTLDYKISQAFDLARQLSQDKIQKYPTILSQYLDKNFKKNSLQCFLQSNDLKLLLFKYHIQSYEQLNNTFLKYSFQKYGDLHEIFLTLIQLFKEKNIEDLSSYTDKSLAKIFKQNIYDPSDDQWGISVVNPQTGSSPYYGISNSNGLIGAVSDKWPFKISKTVLAGAYDKYGRGRVDNIVETVNVLDMDLYVNDVKFPPLDQMNYKQYIDFKKAQFSGSYSINDKASVSYKYTTLKNNPGAFYLVTQIVAHDNISIKAKNYHRVPDYLNDVQKQFQNVPNKEIYRVISTKATTKTNKIDIVISSTFFVDDSCKKYLTGDNYGHQDWDSNVHLHSLQNIVIPKGQKFIFYLVSSLISSEHHLDPKNQAIRLLLKTASTKPDLVLYSHQALWEDLWKNDIIIQGNSYDQRIVRSMVYHFYSFINEFKSYGLSPMGLSGLGYNGHVFWDMDLWMFPGILILNPKLAKSLIQYRYYRLQAARNNAFLNGYKGVMFPWESSKTGDQQCPIWAAPGPLEHHITGTVALAAWKYYCVTKDLDWLKEKGKEIIEGAAEFWESRVEKDQNGVYHINNVVAADQWAQNVDDDAFTNAIAIQSLRIANKMRTILSIDTNKNWDDIRAKIIIHRFPDTNVTKEYATYNGQNIKQADVNLLSFPLKQVTQKNSVLKDLEFYQNKVPVQGTPAMTQAIFALLYSRLLNTQKSYNFFKMSFKNNLLPPFDVMAQTQFGTNPYFLTGAGGVIQSVIFGFAGIDITDQGISTVQSVIPDQWSRVIIKSSVVNGS